MTVSAITRFVAPEGEYIFSLVQDWEDNFGSLNGKMSNVSGADGAIDEYGSIRAPKAKGTVKLTMNISARSSAEATQKRDDLHKIVTWSKGRLFMQPADPNADERWCEARLVSIPRKMNLNQHDDFSSRIPISFASDFPYWLTQGTFPWTWGDGTQWGVKDWGDAGAPQICSGLQTDFTIARTGTAPILPTINITCTTGQATNGITIRRMRGLLILDEVVWDEALNEGDNLIIDAWRWKVTLNGVDAYDNRFSEKLLRWLQLDTGDNTIRVIQPGIGDSCTVSMNYYEAFN